MYKIHFLSPITLFAALILCTSSMTFAQQVSIDWQVDPGPRGGQIRAIAENPYTGGVWAVANDIVHYSDDYGEEWIAQEIQGVYGSRFAFSEAGGVFFDRYRTYNQGQTWEKIALPDSVGLLGLHLDPQRGHLIAHTSNGVYISSDEGESWGQSFAGLSTSIALSSGVLAVLVYDRYDPADPWSIVLSEDGGVSWKDVASPLLNVWDLFVAPGGGVYVMGDSSLEFLMYRSLDRGETWEVIHRGGSADSCPAAFRDIIEINDQAEILFRGGPTRYSIENNSCISYTENFPDVYDITGSALEKDEGIQNLSLGQNGRLYAFTERDNLLYRSDDNGESWRRLSMDGITGGRIHPLYVDASNDYMLASNESGLFRKQDGDHDWTYIGPTAEWVSQILTGPTPGSLWVLTRNHIYASADGGQKWSLLVDHHELTGRQFYEVYAITYDEERGIHYVYEAYDIFYSADNGVSWESANVPHESQADRTVTGMEITPEGHLLVYARHDLFAGLEGIWLTKDLGETWELILEEKLGFPGFFYDSTDQLWMYSGSNVGLSLDGGVTWEQRRLGDHYFSIYDMTETPDHSFWLNHSCGLILSMDRGKTWRELFPDGTLEVPSFTWVEEDQEVAFSTNTGQIYRGFIGTSVGVDAQNTQPNKVDGLTLSTYPNPVISTANLQFSLRYDAQVVLDVFDSLGRQVVRLLDQHLSVGDHEVSYNTSGLSPGVYMVRLQTPDAFEIGSFVHVQ